MALQGCFDCTLWEVFNSPDINDQAGAVSDDINFCFDSVIPKILNVFTNDKPWVSNKLNYLFIGKRLTDTKMK